MASYFESLHTDAHTHELARTQAKRWLNWQLDNIENIGDIYTTHELRATDYAYTFQYGHNDDFHCCQII